ncbi:MAG: chromosome segregation protein SMC [Candidatus Promineifilaceae bacterium]
MKLKKLSLQGYKTFASRTEFLFDEGITAVVGPNGSGKSNIADAIRWVLGEQSYSTLRGKRTEDMIFAGSQTRARAGLAQAVLTLDNSDGWLPIDYAEVEIGRRAYRSGENEYVLNGQKVRLKDIADLLATSGLAERTYTIIGQGLVDRALSLRADERRALFEEAAGIMHYKTRRAETLRRLKETEHNLERIQDILSEIRPRLASLRRQATRARNYELVQQDLRALLRTWYGFKWDQALRQAQEARKAAAAAERTWQESREALLAQQQKVDRLQNGINEAQQKIGAQQEQRETLRERLEMARRQSAVLAERRAAAMRRLEELERELPGLQMAEQAAQVELEAALADLNGAQGELDRARERLAVFNQSVAGQRAEIQRWQQALAGAERGKENAQRELAQAVGQISQLRERLGEYEAELAGQDESHMRHLQADVTRQTAVIETAQAAINELREQREGLQRRRQQLIRGLKQRRGEAKDREKELAKRQGQIARLESRVELLDQMRHTEIEAGEHIELTGTLAGLITIPDTHRRALEAALAARLETLIVADQQSLLTVLDNLDGKGASLVALDKVRSLQWPLPNGSGIVGWASELVDSGDLALPAIQLLLGNILLVANQTAAFDVAERLPDGTLAVTPDGLVVHAGGLVEAPGSSAAESVLARETAFRAAQEELAALRVELAAEETAVEALQAGIQQDQDEVDALLNDDRRLGKLETDRIQQLSTAQRQLDRDGQQRAYLQRQRDRAEQEIGRLRERIAALESKLEGGREAIQEQETHRVEALARLESLPVLESRQEQAANEQEVTAKQTIVAGRQAVVDSRRTTLNQLQGQLARLRSRRAEIQEQLNGLAEEAAGANVQEFAARLDELEQKIQPLQAVLAENRASLATIQQASGKLQRATHESETRYTQTQVRLTQQESQIEALQERIRADLGLVSLRFDADHAGPTPLPISEIVEELPKVEELPAHIESSIQDYRGQLQRMGGINPDAPQEYEETEQRYEFLTGQVEDLHETEAHLRRVIAELDELTSRAFAETVEKVDEVFGATFTQLFGGGSARLVLTEPDDLTISGVDIVARLPNQREQGLALLSGGERSLTASALIFSLLKVSPTPFCVLDEVDAALDEANVNRFRGILRELSLNTQFIVITHNRGTVQAANTIYGVSMQPDSASQVISIRPESYAARE